MFTMEELEWIQEALGDEIEACNNNLKSVLEPNDAQEIQDTRARWVEIKSKVDEILGNEG